MASTVLTDVNFLSEVWKDTFAGEFTHKLELYNGILMNGSGILSPDSGYSQAIPHWTTLSGDSVQITTSTTTTVNNLTDYKDVGIWCEREKAWGADQMLKVVAGEDKDVTVEVARQVGEYWAGEVHRLWLKAADGVFTTTLAATHVKDGSGSNISVENLNAAKALLGDAGEQLTEFISHSKVAYDAINTKIATYDKATVDTYLTGRVGQILGMNYRVSDKLAAVASVYPCYLGARGAGVFLTRPRPSNAFTNANLFNVNGPNGINIQIELMRDSDTGGGQDVMISRSSLMVHIPGVAWQTSSVASNPTDAQLATGTSWSKVANDDKLIKLVKYNCA